MSKRARDRINLAGTAGGAGRATLDVVVTRDDRYSYGRVAISTVGESGEQTIYGIADEKAGGYIAFVTDEKTAAKVVSALRTAQP